LLQFTLTNFEKKKNVINLFFQDLLDHWTIFHWEWFLKINNHQSFSIVISGKGNETNTNIIKSLFSMIHNHRGSPYFFSEWSSLFLLTSYQTCTFIFDLPKPCYIFLRNNNGKWLMVVNLEKSFSMKNFEGVS
jgi:hypothetical protein